MKLVCSKTNPPLGGLLLAEYLNSVKSKSVEVVWADKNAVLNATKEVSCETNNEVLRALARAAGNESLYGGSAEEKTHIDHWLTQCIGPLVFKTEFASALNALNKDLGPVTYLANKQVTIADFAVFASLYVNKQWQDLISSKKAPINVLRWYNFIKSFDCVNNAIENLPNEAKNALNSSQTKNGATKETTASGRTREGKFIDLPGAEMGKVVVRFPPEASGYLHIGHAKAALLNQYYQEAFEGKLIMRFDDTNPAKEDVHFEKVILEDVKMLEIKPDMFTHTSQYFDLMIEYCEKMIKDGNAYVDDTDAELMKEQREQKIESANRCNSPDKNFKMWEEMKKGTPMGQKCCVRAKIDMQSLNGCMRDPTIYRCKPEPHPRTGTQFKVYPTYDFACPIVDAIEGVTHTLRTMEYHDRDPQFYWFIDVLGLRKPYIWEYSRLSMTNTVLSKRKLTWFVNEGLVDGWDDPRMPTVRGVLRRGMTVEGLKEFIIAQGSSRSVVFMEWDKIWAFNKKIIDPIAPRYTAVDYDSPVPVLVKNAKEECIQVPKHPKNPDLGNKSTWYAPKILIDRADAEVLKANENATFVNWGNLLIKKINRKDGAIVSIEAEPNLDNKDFKKTVKLTWLADTPKAKFTPTFCVYFNHIISKSVLGKDEDFKQFIGHETRKEVQVLGDPELKNLKQGDIIQIQRRGFFKVDVPYGKLDVHTCKEQPVVLFFIPDGSAKDNAMFPIEKQEKTSKKSQSPQPKSEPKTSEISTASDINEQIIKQGLIVRELKAQKSQKTDIDVAVKTLLELKTKYKSLTNTEWKPGCVPPSTIKVEGGNGDTSGDLDAKIRAQGETVRKLKSEKASKQQIDSEVKTLLSLKTQFKTATGKDWAPNSPPSDAKTAPLSSTKSPSDESTILSKIATQGDKIRELKSKKADKGQIDVEVKLLLSLKEEYKKITGKAWAPGATAEAPKTPQSAPENNNGSGDQILVKIAAQGEKVRQLKLEKAAKPTIEAEVKTLLALKNEYKTTTGQDWGPNLKPQSSVPSITLSEAPLSPPKADSSPKDTLIAKVNEQANLVRDLKAKKASKDEVDSAVKSLLELKAEYKTLTGEDFPVAGRTPSKPKAPKAAKETTPKPKNAPKEKKQVEVTADESGPKKQTRLGLEAKKEENLANWYSQVITKGEMIEYYDVSGCYIFRPWSFSIWEAIKDWFDSEIKKLGVQNCYFPIFVSKAVLEKEKDHIADFAPEVAWVTKSGDSEMAEPIAVRPTSETVMYPAYAKWIQSYRDLPIKLNQWNNVVRWEFKHPQPFLRTREFLWQEGHTAYALKEEAIAEVTVILDLYARIYTDLLAIPVVKGRKTEKEKFAGGDYTLTVEAFVSASGRAIQGATSHHLGQNFSKMFDIIYEDPETQEKKYVYQNSWGCTTRTIGVMIMVHADNQGLVLPPKVACVQIVIVPCGITANLSEKAKNDLQSSCDALENDLQKAGVRVKGDYRSNYSPGWKFNHWELKGVPIRVELGPKDIEKNQLVAVRRDTGEKITISRNDAVQELSNLLTKIQENLLYKATQDLNSHKITLTDWSQFSPNLDKKNIILAPFCGDIECEDKIKADSTRDDVEGGEPGAPSMGAKSLCIPLEQPTVIKPNDRCIHPDCKRKPQFYTLFGRSY